MKPRLIILSDLWGQKKAQWVVHYQEQLQAFFDIKYYDCCQLGAIDTSIYTEKNLHQQFVHGGIEKAGNRLATLKKETVTILAFSIGGAIAWNAILKGLKATHLYAVSATRLRHQTSPLEHNVQLYFGATDPYLPTQKWLDSIPNNYKIIPHQGHMIYRMPKFVATLCNDLQTNIKN